MSQAGGDAVLAAGAPAADTHPNPQPAHSAEMGSNAHTPAAENGSLSPSSPQQPQHHLPETPLQANPERKRKSRWGSQVEDSQATAAALAAQPQQPQPTDGDGEAGDGEPRKRSRFSSRTASPAPPAFPGMVPAAPNIPGLVPGLPGMPPGMPLGMPGMPGMPGFPGPPPGMPGMLPPGGVAAGGPPPGPPPTPFGLTPGSPEFKEMQEIQKKLEKVNLRMARLEMGVTEDPENPGDRSPSPEPTYDANGVRTNTRIQRYRSRFLKERTELLERLMSLNPAFAGAMPKTQKQFSKKIWVPQEEYPDRNFRGLIIGPRGNTHRRMEEETGCKISIRGKGAHSKNSVRPQPGDDEPMHVLVTAENEEDFQKGIAVIEKLLMPNNEEADQHKARQLRELAAINGTIRRVVCHVCGAEGHTIATCPDRTGAKWTAANVLCNICGSTSHIDQDCPTRQNLKPGEALPNIHMEYANFMAELTGEAPPGGFLTDGTGGPRLALTMAEGAGGGGGHQSGLEAGGAPREMLGAPGPSDAPPPPPPHDHGRSHPHNHPHSHSHPHPLSHSHSPSYHAQREHIGGGAPPQRELIGASSLAPREYAGPGGHVHGHHPGPAREFIGGPPPPPSQPQYAPAPREMMGGHHGHREFIGGAPPQLPQAHQQHQQHQQHPSNGGGPVRELIGASPAAPPVGPPPPPPHAPYDPYAGYGYAAPPQGSYPGYPPQDQSAYYAPPPPPPPGLPYPGHHDPYGYGGNPPADAYAGYASQGDPYGQSGVAYGQLADAYGQQASAYGQPAETYGQPADSYGQHAAAYGQQGPPGYHAVPPPGHYGSDPQQPPPQ